MTKIIDHGTWPFAPADEGTHPVGSEQLWNESYYFDFASPDGSIGGYVRLGSYPNWDRAWYWACLVGDGRPLVIVADNEAPLPSGIGGEGALALDVEGRDYTARQEIGRPLESARVRLDAQAVLLDDPTDAYGLATGTGPEGAKTCALGFDLEWSTVGGVYPYSMTTRYEIPSRVHGTIRVGDESIDFSGYGQRDHSWSARDWWSMSWLWTTGRMTDGTAFHGTQVNLGMPIPAPAFVVPPDGELEHVEGLRAHSRFGADGLPAESEVNLPGAATTVRPKHFAPVAMLSPDGKTAHFPRALCRFEAADGRVGHGWTEWHQPPGWRGHDWSPSADASEG